MASLVVARMRAVGGADFDAAWRRRGPSCRACGRRRRSRPARRARRSPPCARRQRVERQQHRGGVVVDHRGGLGAGDFAQQLLDELVAVAAAAAARDRTPGWSGRAIAPARAAIALSASSARPRLVCSTVPVRLKHPAQAQGQRAPRAVRRSRGPETAVAKSCGAASPRGRARGARPVRRARRVERPACGRGFRSAGLQRRRAPGGGRRTADARRLAVRRRAVEPSRRDSVACMSRVDGQHRPRLSLRCAPGPG